MKRAPRASRPVRCYDSIQTLVRMTHMRRSLSRFSVVSAAALLTACVANPGSRAPADGHDAAARAHLEFARDSRNAGDETMAQYHVERAQRELEQKAEEQCGLLCASIDRLLIPAPTIDSRRCRDPITTSPTVEPRC